MLKFHVPETKFWSRRLCGWNLEKLLSLHTDNCRDIFVTGRQRMGGCLPVWDFKNFAYLMIRKDHGRGQGELEGRDERVTRIQF